MIAGDVVEVAPLSVKKFKVLPCNRDEITSFIQRWHYSGSINGCISDFCFKLTHNGQIIGAAFFGRMAMANQWKRFSKSETDVIELRRLCCIDDTPKNTESYFIGHMLRWLRKNTNLRVVVSYADMEHSHTGTIYKASNFECWGKQAGAKIIMWNGKRYHDKAIRTKYKGKLKPFAQKLKNALAAGEANYQTTAGKVTYVYFLRPNAADGPRYKALGNSMAVPVMAWIGKRIQMVEDLE